MTDRAFAGKSVLVTGAASGIGRATALAFGRAGAAVVVADVTVDAGEETAAAIVAAGGSATFVRCDVTRGDDVAAAVAAAVQHYGRLDCAFNNAGIEEEHKRLGDSEEAMFDRMMAVNVKGVWLCMKHELRQMKAQGSGAIVNTASVAGLVGAPMHAIYAGTKHAVVGLTRSAAAEYGKANIRVNAVCPAVIRTPMLERAIERDPRREDALIKIHPIGRIGEADEIAAAVLWLCSDAASFVTGHSLAVDGGMTIV